MTGRGRGRGRGRAREPQQQQQQEPHGPSYAQTGGGAAAPQPGAAGGPRGGPAPPQVAQPQAAQPQELAEQMGQLNFGCGACRPAPAAASAAGEPGGRPAARNGNGNGTAPVGRGAMRGRRQIDFAEVQRTRTRPDHLATKIGTEGRLLTMRANYFRINTVPDWALHQYRVDIAPEEGRTFIRKKLLRSHQKKLGGYIFDGTVLYCSNRLTTPQNNVVTFTSILEDVPDSFTITMKEVGEVDRGDFTYIQIFNLLLRTCIAGLGLKLVGRDYYDAEAKVPVPTYKFELWPGYKTSIRQHENDILLCVEITHKVMRMETILDILCECFNRNSQDYRRQFVMEVVGCIVLTKYNNKTYRIHDVDWNTNPNNTFDFHGEQISYADYMLKKYQITINDRRQPMLVSRARARDVRAGMSETINLIPEVCFCTGLTDAMRNNFRLMRELAVHTRVAPSTRIQKLRDFNRRLLGNKRTIEQLENFNMTLERDIVQINGKELQEETILFDNYKVKAGREVDWTSELRQRHMLRAITLENWAIVVPSNLYDAALKFSELLEAVGRSMNIIISYPRIYKIDRDVARDYVQKLSDILDMGQPQLIMCVVRNNRRDFYSAIKKKCCVDRPVATQVVVAKNLNDPKRTRTIATKVAIQMNCKVGGAPWGIEIPDRLRDLMVVGFDVCHDTATRSHSFGAMVASLDKAMARYYSAVTPHTNGEELSNNFALNIMKAVKKYHAVNSTYPSNIVIYRDGVGEGQIPQLVSHELDQIKGKLAQLSTGIKMTFVIVTKRINTRLFTHNDRNPSPGTVVDDVITDPEKYDFFLVSQSVREGTVSPTSYNVIHDGMALPAGMLQRLTYKMCHLYFNWSGTVRVPAPCQYAHKLAFLVGQAIHQEPSSQLEDLLYFL